MLLLTAVFLMTAVYAHVQLPRYTAGSGKRILTRAVLVLTGLGFGLVTGAAYADEPVGALLAGLIGFGAVHAPAAIILFVKQARGSGKS